jgi:hypothetical protein
MRSEATVVKSQFKMVRLYRTSEDEVLQGMRQAIVFMAIGGRPRLRGYREISIHQWAIHLYQSPDIHQHND